MTHRTRRPASRQIAAVLFAALAVPALPAATATAAEHGHLPIIPRTKAEASRIAKVTAPTKDFSKPETYEKRPGGAATSFKLVNRDAFSQPSANMPFERELMFKVGNGIFKKVWVTAPSSTDASDGLGPLYNARACQRCHLKDGRGHPPAKRGGSAVSLFLRVSTPVDARDYGKAFSDVSFATKPDPRYGLQIQDLAIAGHAAEAKLAIDYKEITVALSEGETVTLLKPKVRLEKLGYGPTSPTLLTSVRVAPPMIGLGLLEAIPVKDILANADPEDKNGDGISGRANWVESLVLGRVALGRFGWKAGNATVRDQTVGAFSGDMGLSTSLRPNPFGECTLGQLLCRKAPHGGSDRAGGYEVDDKSLDLVVFYSRNLAVPARRDVDDPVVLRGKEMFYSAGCASCHKPKFVTHRLKTKGPNKRPEQSFQLIWPYTDLLLHDMGEGLADGRPEAKASGREWRTPPLWGIGLTKAVSGHTRFLHDGRARSLLEAIMWHGGEAKAARDVVAAMRKADRDALIKFLESL